ncbi:hypothetical protein Ahy_B08g089749 [Arachis hypogaea]|uniref:PB1-like domain-containing protein n=1 Tax=Arachis hypogaea TaxID=3818 RepID=A0A444XYR2_ARAHY|nr:hypothetical protein Ahy_B08g089749 [Arachis hypogaea]
MLGIEVRRECTERVVAIWGFKLQNWCAVTLVTDLHRCNNRLSRVECAEDGVHEHEGASWGAFGYEEGVFKYLNGQSTIIEDIDGDRWSVFEAYEELRQLGYLQANIEALWYKDPSLDDLETSLKMLKGDEDAIKMCNIAGLRGLVELYVVHDVGNAEPFPKVGYVDVGELLKRGQMMGLSWLFSKGTGLRQQRQFSDEDGADSDELEIDHMIGGDEGDDDDAEDDADDVSDRGGRWQMSGLPCPHAISSITFKGLDLELFVDDHYKKNAYLRRPSHRPVKKRKRGPGDEDNRSQTHLSRRGQTQKCSNYGALGHKKSGCTKPKKKVQYATQQAGKGPKRGIKVASSQPLGQTVQRGKLSRTSCSQPNSATTQPNPATTQPKKPSNPKAPLSQPLPKKSSAAASSTSNKESDSQPTDRKRHFSVIQTGAPHIPLQKLKLMAKLPPSAWDNL